MKLRYLLASLLLLVLFSCDKKERHQMDKAEALLSEFPDSALAVLDKIDPFLLRSRGNRARYALLKSAALDKNYIDVTVDSLTRQAVDYYSVHKNKRYEMLAWYYHGIVLKNAQSYTASIIALEEAEKVARELDDSYQRGLVLRNKAEIFNAYNNYLGAIECWKQTVDCFGKADKENYKAWAEAGLAVDYHNNREYQKADSLYERIRQYDNPNLNNYCNKGQAAALAEMNTKPELSIELYNKTPKSFYGVLDYGRLATAFETIGQTDSADYWFSQGYLNCKDAIDSVCLGYLRSRIELGRGHYETAFHLVDRATTVQDSLTRILLQQSVNNAQRDYYKNETLLQEEKNRSLRQKVAFGAVLALLAGLVLVMAANTRSRKKDRLLQEQMARLALEERELERVNRDNAHLVGSLFSEKIDHLDKLAETYFRSEDAQEKERTFKQIKHLASSIRNDDALFLSMEKDLDRYCNGIVSKLREQVPRISGENLRIIMLFFAGFPYETVKFILNKNSVESLKMARSRFRKEILAASAPDADLFLKMLEMKKRP